ncbi:MULTISPECIES: DUF5682 family protein [unclassified Streptomyces]|uniref:DUF5682 family protein n=1 Tax=unclassified Streptomyces TaxID=2593676 RepID=UPI00093B0E19|nr:DUF5682 family protein [Streptomyces sp. CB02058]OKI94335.1 hypothetical protein AMK10_18680 [Streptomyces sp. CB02058]
MSAVFLGVRHHSPACARLVERTIAELRPAHVLVEGPAEMNPRLDELLLGHELPVAVFSHYRDGERAATSWAPLCDYSPEWVALRAGRAAGAEVRFIDLPAWHPAFAERTNRYADAEVRYAEATDRLCSRFAVDSPDALWDRLFEVEPDEGLAERLDAYFTLVRGEAVADARDRARESYMARWVRAAVRSAGGRPVLVVTGGFHQPALRALVSDGTEEDGHKEDGGPEHGGGRSVVGTDGWPEVPAPPAGALAGSFLVPYSFRRLDSFSGYQSGMPSPGYYQQVWEEGPEAAAEGLLRAVVERLRSRRYPVSTADLVAARSLSQGLTALRGHPSPARIDVLDGLAGALITDDLEAPLPWTSRSTLAAGTHPAVVEMVAACSGARFGRLHPDTPAPPLVHDVEAELARLELRGRDAVYRLDLMDARDLERSRVLHRLRVLGVPGHERTEGPRHGMDPVSTERWEHVPAAGRDAALVEAGAYGGNLAEAAATALAERAHGGAAEADTLASVLFDAVLCGVGGLSEDLLGELAARVRALKSPGPLGDVLSTALGLWRHDQVYGVARGPLLASVIDGATGRLLWLLEGARGGPGVDVPRLRAVAAVRDALLHAAGPLSLSRGTVAGVALRISRDTEAPDDLRGAAFGLHRALADGPHDAQGTHGAQALRDVPGGIGDPASVVRAVAAGGASRLGDWLAGLFALAREEVTGGGTGIGGESLIEVLDGLVGGLSDEEFLSGLPALRQAFAYFPPIERERIAAVLLERRAVRGSARGLLRTTADPLLLARAGALEENVFRVLARHGLRDAS